MKSAIVTGADGFIGTHLVRLLCEKGVDVTALCLPDSSTSNRLPEDVSVVHKMGQLPQADAFFHLAWASPSGAGRADAGVQARNITLTIDAIKAAKECGAKFIGLGTIYERFAKNVMESGQFSNPNFYILSKHFASEMSSQFAYQNDMQYVWCQICHPIGRFIKREQLMAYVVSGLLGGKPPALGSASTYFDIIAVEDVALALYLIAECDNARRGYFIGSGTPLVLRDYLEKVRGVLGVEAPLLYNQRAEDGLSFSKEWFNIGDLCDDTGFCPGVSFENAVENVKEWILESGL